MTNFKDEEFNAEGLASALRTATKVKRAGGDAGATKGETGATKRGGVGG